MRPGDDPHELALHVLLAELVAHLRLEPAGRERVDADPLAPRPLLGEVAREPDQAGLARGVGGLRQPTGGEPEDAGDVDDRAARLHHLGRALRHPVAAVEVDVDHLAEVVGRLLGRGDGRPDAGVVDQHVDAAQVLHRLVDERLAAVGVRDVRAHGDGAPAGGLDELARVLELLDAAGAEGDVRAGLGEGLGERDAEAGRGPGDDGDFSFEAEAVQDGHGGEVPAAARQHSPGSSTAGVDPRHAPARRDHRTPLQVRGRPPGHPPGRGAGVARGQRHDHERPGRAAARGCRVRARAAGDRALPVG